MVWWGTAPPAKGAKRFGQKHQSGKFDFSSKLEENGGRYRSPPPTDTVFETQKVRYLFSVGHHLRWGVNGIGTRLAWAVAIAPGGIVLPSTSSSGVRRGRQLLVGPRPNLSLRPVARPSIPLPIDPPPTWGQYNTLKVRRWHGKCATNTPATVQCHQRQCQTHLL